MKKTTKVLTASSIVALTLFAATLDSKADTSDGVLNTDNAGISTPSNNSDSNVDNSSNVARIRRVREIETSDEEEEEEVDEGESNPNPPTVTPEETGSTSDTSPEPQPAEPEPARPEPIEPTVSEPTVSEPTVSEPTVSEPTVSEPTVSPEPVIPDPHINVANKGTHATYIERINFNKNPEETDNTNNISAGSNLDDNATSNGENKKTDLNKLKIENNNEVTGKDESENPDRFKNNSSTNYDKDGTTEHISNKKMELNRTRDYRKTIDKINSKLPKTGDSSVAISASAGLGSLLSLVLLRKKKK